jgi:ABC-type uncharacterized transport system substrate-binding protein
MKLWLSVLTLSGCLITSAQAANCFYINSYHQGYEWSDRIQAQFSKEMKTVCNISYHYLNAKKETNPNKLKNKGMEIANLIALSQPDIVIAADDAASEYVVNPYLRNGQTPVIYVGINWDPRPFGYPMSNATGMTEVWPIEQSIKLVKSMAGNISHVAFISSNNKLEINNAAAIKRIMKKNKIELHPYLVSNFDEWKAAVKEAQQYDVIEFGTDQGIDRWNKQQAVEFLKTHNSRFTFASQDFMLPYSMATLSESPEEFGHWAAELTRTIFKGDQPWQIPIIPNRIFISRYNPLLLSKTDFKIPDAVIRQSIVYKDN